MGENWLREIERRHLNMETWETVIVALKDDLAALREVTTEEGREFAARHGLPYVECSSRSGSNVQLAVATMVDGLLKGNEQFPAGSKLEQQLLTTQSRSQKAIASRPEARPEVTKSWFRKLAGGRPKVRRMLPVLLRRGALA